MNDFTKVRLGKREPRIDTRTLKLAKYLKTTAPAPPAQENWLKLPEWQMYGNDTLGDCVEAAAGHMINLWQSWTANTAAQPTQAQIIASYSGATGYVPGDPSTDQGTDMISFLNYWRHTGVAGHKIAAYVALSPGNLLELRQAIYLFGAAFIGLALPVTAQSQAVGWTVPAGLTGNGAPGSWGGHCVPVGAYDVEKPASIENSVVTWGEVLTMSDYFYQCYNDEGYAVLSADWIASNSQAPNGFDLDALQADLAAL
jgi:hypothetical protein